jgi:hypothetical protein
VRAPVYSVPLVQSAPGAVNLSFEIPEGYTAVIRQISLSVTVATGIIAVNIQDSDEAPQIAIHQTAFTDVYASQHTEGRWVVPENGIISIYIESEGVDVYAYIGGYLLGNS